VEKKTPKSQSQMLLEIVARIQEDMHKLRELKRNGHLNAHEQAAVLTVFFEDGPETPQQSPEQQAAVLKFLFGG
jgi:hypothetical protein